MARAGKFAGGEVIRTFIALELPENLRMRMSAAADRLKGPAFSVRKMPENGMHLTLKFIGDTPLNIIGEVGREMEKLAARHTEIEVRIRGAGAFPSPQRPRAVVAMVEENEDLSDLRTELEEMLADEFSIPPDKRKFVPHVTIARLKSNRHREFFEFWLSRYVTHDFGSCTCDTVVHFRSELRKSGALYTPLATADLGETSWG